VRLPEHALDDQALSWRELQVVAAKLIGEITTTDADAAMANSMLAVDNGDGTIG